MPPDPAAAALQIMYRAMAASQAAAASQSRQSDDDKTQAKLAAENRSAYRQQLQKAFDAGDENRINALIPEAMKAGVDVGPYRVKPPAEAQVRNEFNQMLAQSLGLSAPPQPSPFESTEVAYDIPENSQQRPTQRPTTAAMQQLEKLFTPEFAAQVVAKQAGGITVDEHALTDRDWFNDYARLPDSMDASSKKETLAAKYGYIPMQASQLKDLSIEERKAITQGAIVKLMGDPDIDAAFRKHFPNGDDKTKMGVILGKLVGEQGMPVPNENYQRFLDRFINLHDDIVDFKVNEAARREAATTGARLGTEFAMEAQKPVSAEDRAKYGIGAKIPTYTDLANSGFRFPTEADRKMYSELSAVRDQIADMRDLLFGAKGQAQDGIFTGVGKDWVSRKGAQATLLKERATGSQRGQNYEIYSDVLASMARRLLTLAGESGGRFTDVDVQQITRSAPDLGGAISPMDSEPIARQKFERFIVGLNQRLDDITGGVAIKPMGGEGGTTPKAAPPAEQTGISANELKALKAHPNKILTNKKTGRSWRLDPQGNPIEVTK